MAHQNIYCDFCISQKHKIDINLDSFTPDSYCVGCHYFLFDSVREKRSVPLTSHACMFWKMFVAHWLKNHCFRRVCDPTQTWNILSNKVNGFFPWINSASFKNTVSNKKANEYNSSWKVTFVNLQLCNNWGILKHSTKIQRTVLHTKITEYVLKMSNAKIYSLKKSRIFNDASIHYFLILSSQTLRENQGLS